MDYIDFGKKLQESASAARHRYCLVISGSVEWGLDCAQNICTNYESARIVFVADPDSNNANQTLFRQISFSQCRAELGSEHQVVIYNCHSGMEPDSLGAIGGTIVSGGLLILLTPEFEEWPTYPDTNFSKRIPYGYTPPDSSQYIHRFINRIEQSIHCHLLRHGQALPHIPNIPNISRAAEPQTDLNQPDNTSNFDTSDQKAAIEAVKKVVSGQRKRPAILLADRGRGKSAALGIAAKELLENGLSRIGICGSNRKSLNTVFKHAKLESINNLDALKFIPADSLVAAKADVDLLLIDEAASIPMPLLARILQLYPRVVFASTVHGYEGTGRGFAVRFNELLEKHTRGWKTIELRTPIRWAEHDPLEAFLYDTLLLDTEIQPPKKSSQSIEKFEIRKLEPKKLVESENQLREIFGLLVHAHHRTRPADLRYLLDSPNLVILCGYQKDQLLAVAVLSLEGGLSETIAKKIWTNRSRPCGHLFPELVAAQLGFFEGAQQTTARLVRIVVRPEFQRIGIGSQLLEIVSSQFKSIDSLSTSFGANMALIRFWSKNGFIPIRLGINQSTSSGTHSCALIRPFSNDAKSLTKRAQNKFQTSLTIQLKSVFQQVDPMLIREIYLTFPKSEPNKILSPDELSDIIAFGFAQQNMDNISSALLKFSEFLLSTRKNQLPVVDALFLIERALQSIPWKQCKSLAEPRGAKMGQARLRAIIRQGFMDSFPEQTQSIQKDIDL